MPRLESDEAAGKREAPRPPRRRKSRPRKHSHGRSNRAEAARCSKARSTTRPSPGISSCSAHHVLDGFGGMGEGMSIQIAPDGRRILWLAHESAPKNFTAVDVSDPRKPKVVVQTDLPQAHMRSNSLETCGNLMAVAYQTQKKGQQPAGMELFDISVPEKPKSISFFDCSGPTSRGVHQLWFCDGEYVHMRVGRGRLQADASAIDDQFYRCIDVRNPSKPVELGRWWHARHQAGRQRDAAAAPSRSTRATAPTTATSIRSGRTAAISPISTAGCSCSTFPTRPTRSAFPIGPTRRPIPALCTRWCRCSTAASCW